MRHAPNSHHHELLQSEFRCDFWMYVLWVLNKYHSWIRIYLPIAVRYMITITSSAQCICALYIGIFVHRFDMMAWPNDSSVWGDGSSEWYLLCLDSPCITVSCLTYPVLGRRMVLVPQEESEKRLCLGLIKYGQRVCTFLFHSHLP
jgi:hypothetical protein